MARRAKKREEREDGRRTAPRVRPIWSGTLTFGLVSVPVDLYPAVRSRRASLRMLDEHGAPLERRYFDPETGRTVPSEAIVRGYELESGEFVVVEDEELESLAPEKTRDIDLRRFVPVEALDPIYFQRSYFLAPGGQSTKAYRLLAEAMERSGRSGIATFVMRGVEYLAAIVAERGILRAETLRFQDEVRAPEDVGLPEPGKAPAAATRRMAAQIRSLSGEGLEEAELEDPSVKRLEAVVRRKLRGGEDVVKAPGSEAAEAPEARVIDLLEVLKKTMAAAEAGRGRKPAARAGRRGGGGTEESLEALSKDELYERAKELDVPGRSSMNKKELVRAIRGAA